MSCMADTGCQACCMGPRQLYKLGMTKTDLLEPLLGLSAANKTGINILGAVYLAISGKDKLGKLWKSNQLCYVAESGDQFLVSLIRPIQFSKHSFSLASGILLSI